MLPRLLLVLLLCFFTAHTVSSQQTIGLFKYEDSSYEGYTLCSAGTYHYLIDNCGNEINRWQSEHEAGLSAYLLPNGHLLRAAKISGSFRGGGLGGRLEEFDWQGNLVWSYSLATEDFHQHHDIEPLPNGNILVILWEKKTAAETVANGAEKIVDYWSEAIIEIERVDSTDANVVWEWHVWDHLIQNLDVNKANYGVVEGHPELFDINYKAPRDNGASAGDWLHFNSVDYDPLRDEIIISSPFWNEFFIIDHSTTSAEAASHSGGNRGKGGDLLYRFGNPASYNLNEEQSQLYGQHDARIIPVGYPFAGQLSVFNNGDGRPEGRYSSIDVFKLPRDTEGNYLLDQKGHFVSATATWNYTAENPEDFFTANQGGAEILPNGHFLICETLTNRFFEVDSSGIIVWEYINTMGRTGPLTQSMTVVGNQFTSSFRLIRYPTDYIGFKGKDLSPGLPVELDPIPYECKLYQDNINEHSNELNKVLLNYNTINSLLHLTNSSKVEYHLTIYNLQGKKFSEHIAPHGLSLFDLSAYTSGIYLINISHPNEARYISKLIQKI